jgi:Uma2 family endonuclease
MSLTLPHEVVMPSSGRDAGRVPYRLTADQVMRMVEAGIIPDHEDVELWDGVLYLMTKKEPHNYVVGQLADLLRPLIPQGCHVREEKSAVWDRHSLPEPDVAVCVGERSAYLPNVPPLEKLALVVEVNASTPRADHVQKPLGYATAGVPVYWVVDVEQRRVVVRTVPNAAGEYERHVIRRPGETLDVVVGGQECGTIRVEDILPPP